MKRIAIIAALSAVAIMGAGCSGCSTIDVLTNGQPVATGSVAIKADQSLITAYLAATGLNDAAVAAVNGGLLVKGSPQAVKVADGLMVLDTALVDATITLNDAKTAASAPAKIAAIYSMIATLKSQIPGAK